MTEFFRRRGISLLMVILVLFACSLAQFSISYTFTFGTLRQSIGLDLASLGHAGRYVRLGLLALMAVLWLLERKRTLFDLMIALNAFATFMLLLHTAFLLSVLGGLSARNVDEMLLDVVLMAVSNMLIFSVWYWVIDPPGVHGETRAGQPWAFLFPQRAGPVPNFEAWQPRYADYLFVAFTTSFAFSPTDAPPLTRAAKMLMLLQAAVSVVTLTGIAGSAINILAGGSGR